ncbi:MAG: hypothetical protein CL933_12465 [Deltaproteobacteria bacterium]|nr:hypothetical protein [Deltaproteobacteria bacterium]
MLPLALDRLIVHPILNQYLGKELFGSFIWVLGIVNWFGSVAADGFAMLLLRDFVRQSVEAAGRMFRTAFTLTVVLSLLLIPVALLMSLGIADEMVLSNAWSLYLPLGVFAVLRGTSLLLVTNLRIKRRFRTIFGLRVVEAVVLLGNLVIAPTRSLWLIGIVYAASALFSMPIGAMTSVELRNRMGWLDPQWSRWLMAGWGAGALLNILNHSQLYLSRVVLGALSDVGEVAILYAGTAMGNLFVVPVTVLSTLVLSLLGGREEFVFKGRTRLLYVLTSYGIALSVAIASWFGGRWLVANRYPDLAPETLKFYHWIAIANGCVAVMILMRPVVVKYGRLSATMLIAFITLIVQIVALAVWVPIAQAEGAAIGLATALAVAAALWTGMALRLKPAEGDDDE